MGAVRMLFGTELRRRWRSWLILVVLIAVVAGLVLAAAAAGRRTATAFPRFVTSHGYDVYIFNQKPVARTGQVARGFFCHDDRQPRQRPTDVCVHHPCHQPVELLHQ